MQPTPTRRWVWRELRAFLSIVILAFSTACLAMTIGNITQIANGTAALKVLIGKLPSDFKYEPGLVMADGDYVSIHGRYFGYPVIVSSWISTWRTDWLRCVAASYQPDDHGCRVTTRRRRCSRIIVNPSDQRQS
jgi:hypothetical protein